MHFSTVLVSALLVPLSICVPIPGIPAAEAAADAIADARADGMVDPKAHVYQWVDEKDFDAPSESDWNEQSEYEDPEGKAAWNSDDEDWDAGSGFERLDGAVESDSEDQALNFPDFDEHAEEGTTQSEPVETETADYMETETYHSTDTESQSQKDTQTADPMEID